MKLINIGFGNMCRQAAWLPLSSPESAPIKRVIRTPVTRAGL
jgi:regulator of extracellular matrix RemA (YlzA/DUF370 family)